MFKVQVLLSSSSGSLMSNTAVVETFPTGLSDFFTLVALLLDFKWSSAFLIEC